MAKTFSQTEKNILALFPEGTEFVYNGNNYTVLTSGKPSPKKGECKTDIYISTIDDCHSKKEFKISIKQKNANFLENKISLTRAIEIFGNNAESIIENSTKKIESEFKNEKLVFLDNRKKTRKGSITLGWKFEFLNVMSGLRVGIVELTDLQKMDVYAGTNLNESKRNCIVNGNLIIDSGVAEYILEVDVNEELTSPSKCINSILLISEFIKTANIYFAAKALNYRIYDNKWDGPRPLCVWVDWGLENNKITHKIIFEKPLNIDGNSVGLKLLGVLGKLNIKDTNFRDIINYIDPQKVYVKD